MFNILFNNVIDPQEPQKESAAAAHPAPANTSDGSTAKSDKHPGGAAKKATRGEASTQQNTLNQQFKQSQTFNTTVNVASLKTRPVRLPFVYRKSDMGQWMYEHRLGVIATVLLYMIAVILFISIRVSVNTQSLMQGMLVEFPPEQEQPKPEPPPEEKLTQQEFDRQMMQNVKNVAVNENAKLDAGLKDDKGTKANDIYNEARELQERLNANRRMVEQGLKEEATLRDSRNKRDQKQGENDKPQDRKVSGNVTGAYNLEGRTAVYFPIPAYRCESGGKAVVNITVNRNGAVIAAAIDRGSSTTNSCILEMALESARQARFNVDGKAPERQNGTISYIFVPQ